MCRTAILPPSPQSVDALWSVYTSSVTTARRVHYSYDEYLGALEQSGVKLEFCDGEIYAMAGGTPAHAELAASVIRLLGNALRGSCKVYSSD
jgi:Uma2 family endonuclease